MGRIKDKKMPDEVRENALRILKAVYDHVEGRAGVAVVLQSVVQNDKNVNLSYHGPEYNEAVEYLVEEGALEEDEQYRNVAAGVHSGGGLYYHMSRRGPEMLREAGFVE
jgi:hypothetical protein